MRSIRFARPLLAALLISGTAAASAEETLSDAELRSRLESYLDQAAHEGFSGAVLVARRGEVLLERGYGARVPGTDEAVRADTVFTTGSITKQFTAAAILRLEQQGKLTVDDPISEYLGAVPEDKRAITIDLLLSHRAGFPGAIGDDRERVGRDEFVRRALATPLRFAPGDGYEYSNVGYSLAAAIVERVSGKGFERYLHDELFVPAGMRDTGYHLPGWAPDRHAHGVRDDGGDWGSLADAMLSDDGPGWHLLGNGGILSTVGDMNRWHRALMGDAILSPAAKAKLYARHAEEPGGSWYGYGWSIEPTPWGEMVTHNGGNPFFFSDFLRFLDADVVVYYSTTSRDRRMRELGRPLASIVFTGEVPRLAPRAPALRPPGSGEPAAEGSAAARWGLPGTPEGERAGLLLDALAATAPETRAAFAADGFGEAMRARRTEDEHRALLERMRGDLGEFRVRGFVRGDDGLLVALEPGNAPGPMKITLRVEPAPPHRISGLSVQLGD